MVKRRAEKAAVEARILAALTTLMTELHRPDKAGCGTVNQPLLRTVAAVLHAGADMKH